MRQWLKNALAVAIGVYVAVVALHLTEMITGLLLR